MKKKWYAALLRNEMGSLSIVMATFGNAIQRQFDICGHRSVVSSNHLINRYRVCPASKSICPIFTI